MQNYFNLNLDWFCSRQKDITKKFLDKFPSLVVLASLHILFIIFSLFRSLSSKRYLFVRASFREIQAFSIGIDGPRSIARSTRKCPRLDCGRVQICPSMPQNRQLVLQRNASIVNKRCVASAAGYHHQVMLLWFAESSFARIWYATRRFCHVSPSLVDCEYLNRFPRNITAVSRSVSHGFIMNDPYKFVLK